MNAKLLSLVLFLSGMAFLGFWMVGRGKQSASESTAPAAAGNRTATPAAEPLQATVAASGKTSLPSPAGTPAEAIRQQCQAVLNITNAMERKAAFEKLLARLTTQEELEGVLGAFETMYKTGRRHGAEWALLWDTLGHRDPKLAAALIDKNGTGKPWLPDAAGRVAAQWAALDPEAAIRWVDGNPALAGKDLDFTLLNLVQGYSTKDLKAATAYALGVVNPKDPLFASVATTLSHAALQQGGTQGVITWFDTLTTDPQKQGAFEAVAARLDRTDRDALREWLNAHAAQPYRDNDAYRAYAQTLAEQNPQAAMDYVFSEAPRFDNGRYVGLGYAAYEWLVKDAAAFNSWYNSLSDPAQKQAVLHALRDPLADVNFPMKRRRAGEQFLQTAGQP